MIWWSPSKFVFLSVLLALGLFGCAAHHAPHSGSDSGSTRVPASQGDISIAHDFFLRARSQEMAGNGSAALSYYRIAFAYDSANRDLCFLLLDHYREAGMLDSALSLGKSCFALEGIATSVENQAMGEAYLRVDSTDSALRYYEEAFRLDEDNREALYVLVGLYEKKRDLPRFTAAVRKILPMMDYPPRLVEKLIQAYGASGEADSIGPFLNEAWRETGQVSFGEELAAYYGSLEVRGLLSDSTEKDSALNLYEQLLDKNPDNKEILFPYALLLQDRGKLPEACDALKKLVEAHPENPMYRYALGSAQLELHRPEARLQFEKAAALGPGIPDYWARLIYSDLAFGFDSIAAVHESHLPDSLLEGWKNNFFQGLVHSLLAQNLERPSPQKTEMFQDTAASRRHSQIAVEHFRAALAENPGNNLILFELATNLERTGVRDSAVQVLRQLVETDTLNATAMNYLGYMLVEADTDLNYAGRLIDRALSIEPQNGAYLDSKGWWCYRKKDFRAAQMWLTKAVARLPEDPTVLKHLATVQQQLNGRE